MSKRTDVLFALVACIRGVRPSAAVFGLNGDEVLPSRIGAAGRVIVRSGDPGDPEVDLCPLHYWYTHAIPIEVALLPSHPLTGEEAIAAFLTQMEAAILADPTMGGLCEYVELTAPTTYDIATNERGASGFARGADFEVMAFYGTPSPLS